MLIPYTLRNQHRITLKLHRSAKKNIIMRPVSAEQISLNVPPNLSERKLWAWLDANEHLIEKTLSFATQLKPDMPPHIWFHGTPCRLQNHILATIQYENGLFKLPKQDWPQQKQHLRHYLHQHAADTLLPRLHVHAAATGLLTAATALSNAKTFWGVCRRHTGIRLNWRLIGAPDFVTDYICIHELCHLTHPNHSPRFWALVEHHTPHTAAAKTWLKQYGNELFWLD
mgnify:CR=1 FL=1